MVNNSAIENSIVQNNSTITKAKLKNSMIGSQVVFDGKNTKQEISIGDFSEVK